MKNHMYTFNGEVIQQQKGGPIGLGLTGDVAQVSLCCWDKVFIKRTGGEAGRAVLMNKRLIDDINMVLKAMNIAAKDQVKNQCRLTYYDMRTEDRKRHTQVV